jgi:hypothetical protein
MRWQLPPPIPGRFDQELKTYCETEAEDYEQPSQQIHVPPLGADVTHLHPTRVKRQRIIGSYYGQSV